MHRRSPIGAALLLTWACGPTAAPLRPGAHATQKAIAARSTILSDTSLTYDVEITENGRLLSLELGTQFELVARQERRELRRVRLGPPEYDINALAFDATRNWAWVASSAGTVRAISLADGTTVKSYYLGEMATAADTSAADRYLVSGTDSGVLCLRSIDDDALLQCVHAHAKRISAVEARGNRLLSCAWDGSVVLWELPSLRALDRWSVAGSANDCAMTATGAHIAVATSQSPPIRSPEVVAAEQNQRSQLDRPGAIVVLSRDTPQRWVLLGHSATVTSVAWTGADQLVSGSWDRTVRLWHPTTGRDGLILFRFGNLVRRVSADARGQWLLIAGWAGKAGNSATVLLQLLYPTN